MLWRGMIGHRNGPRHAFLRHPHLQRLKEWGDPPLDQVADLFDFLWTFDRAKQLREQLDQCQTGAGPFQFLKGVRKTGKFQEILFFLRAELLSGSVWSV